MKSLLALALLGLCGCGVIRAAAGIEEKPDGTIVVHEDSVADQAAGLVGTLGSVGIVAGAGIRMLTKWIRHKEIIARGQKDDNYDGIPDDQRPPV